MHYFEDNLATKKKSQTNKRSKFLISIVILSFMSLQAVAASAKLCPINLLSQESETFCDPNLYPFLHYPMYSKPIYEGYKVEQYRLFGILTDSTEIAINPEDLNLNFWLFREQVIYPILKNEQHKIQLAIKRYKAENKVNLVSLRLENHPVIVTKKGSRSGEIEVVKTIQTKELRARK